VEHLLKEVHFTSQRRADAYALLGARYVFHSIDMHQALAFCQIAEYFDGKSAYDSKGGLQQCSRSV